MSFTKAAVYSINASIQHASLSGDTSIIAGGTATVTIVPNQGYGLPSTLISVTNAQYSYDNTTGVITLSNPTGAVLILGECPASGMSLAWEWSGYDVDKQGDWSKSGTATQSTSISYTDDYGYNSTSQIVVTASNGSTYQFSTSGDIEGTPVITSNTCTVQLKMEDGWIAENGSLTISCTSGSQTITLTFNWSGWSCLTGDMLVTMADNSQKRIDEIEVGDYVLSYDWDTMQCIPQKVIFTDKNARKSHTEYDKWTFDDGTIIKTVHEHEFYNVENKRMTYMSQWNIGEHAYKEDGTTPALLAHEAVKEEVNHYKITLEKYTNFFVNGLLNGDRNNPANINF